MQAAKVQPVDIKLFDNVEPVTCAPIRQGPVKEQALKEIISDYLKRGIIREHISEWGAPAFVVPKSNGKFRLVVDYRELNKCIRSDHYPLPVIEDLLNRLQEESYFRSSIVWSL